VSARRPSQPTQWRLWRALPGCSYEAAAFDSGGVAATEGCTGAAARSLVVQLDRRGHIKSELPLRRAYNDGSVVDDPSGHRVLVSEAQDGNLGVRYYGWVWTFDGRRLQLVGHYRPNGITLVLAQPL
jgi:hypothetical protein